MRSKMKIFCGTIFLLFGCGSKPTEKTKILSHRDSTMNCEWQVIKGDTVNRKDCMRRRQGPWIVYKYAIASQTVFSKYEGDTSVYKTLRTDRDMIILEEGNYKDGKKEGEWTTFTPGRKVKEILQYKNDSLVKN